MGRWTPAPMTKECSKCGKTYPNTREWFRMKRGKKTPYTDKMCRECARQKSREWYTANKEHARKRNRAWAARNADKVRGLSREWQRRLRYEAMIRHGGNPPICACCGEPEYKFLAIDHIGGGGNRQRKAARIIGGGSAFASWLKKNNYPDGLQVLCHNCNAAKGYYGTCPHADRRDILVAVS